MMIKILVFEVGFFYYVWFLFYCINQLICGVSQRKGVILGDVLYFLMNC